MKSGISFGWVRRKTTTMVLIGLIGLKQSGKDTFADYLVEKHHFRKLAFAEPVKQICQTMFILTEAQLNDPHQKEVVDARWGLSPRQMMQKVGTDMVRQMWGNDFWVKNMDIRHRQMNHDVVVSDVRFPNEAQWVRDRGGLLVRIDDGRGQSTDSHSSETAQASIQEDVCVFNEKNGLETFYEKVEGLIGGVLGSKTTKKNEIHEYNSLENKHDRTRRLSTTDFSAGTANPAIPATTTTTNRSIE
jgi:hypothetical protein